MYNSCTLILLLLLLGKNTCETKDDTWCKCNDNSKCNLEKKETYLYSDYLKNDLSKTNKISKDMPWPEIKSQSCQE